MLDTKTKDTLSAIAFGEDTKPKDRVSASKLLLALGIQTEAVVSLLHTFTEDPDFPKGQKVKAIELIDKYEIKQTEEKVEDTEEMKKSIMEKYGL